jgi:hypothetical protein
MHIIPFNITRQKKSRKNDISLKKELDSGLITTAYIPSRYQLANVLIRVYKQNHSTDVLESYPMKNLRVNDAITRL